MRVDLPRVGVEHRGTDGVVVERPERGVGRTLVEAADLLLAHLERDRRDAPVAERLLRLLPRRPVPADPGGRAVELLDHRLDRGDQAAGARQPGHDALGVDRSA